MKKAAKEENSVASVSVEKSSDSRLKEYKAPELKKYGGIAELVLAQGGNGNDGSGFPPVSLT